MKDGFPHQKIRLIDSFIFIHHPFTFFYQENIKDKSKGGSLLVCDKTRKAFSSEH